MTRCERFHYHVEDTKRDHELHNFGHKIKEKQTVWTGEISEGLESFACEDTFILNTEVADGKIICPYVSHM